MKNFIAFIALVALAGCAAQPASSPHHQPLAAAPVKNFGLWQLNTCKVTAQRAGITLATTHHLSNDTIHLRVSTSMPLAQPPRLSLNALPHFKINLEGKGQHYSAELPYSGRTVARMIRDDSFIVVKFNPQNSGKKPRQAYFSTRGLAQAVAELSKTCT